LDSNLTILIRLSKPRKLARHKGKVIGDFTFVFHMVGDIYGTPSDGEALAAVV